MAVNFGALSQGIETGLRWGAYKDQKAMAERQEQRIERQEQQRTDLHDLNITIKKMQLEALQDDRFRQQTKQDLNAALHYLENVRQGGESYLRQLQQNPIAMQQINQSIQNIGDFMVNRGASDGRPRKFKRFVPTGRDSFMVEMEVQNPDGNVIRAPWTDRRSSDPDDPVTEFTADEIFTDLSKMDALIDMYEAALIQQGDTTPIERKQASIASGLKRRHEIEDREDAQQHDLAKIRAMDSRSSGPTQGDIQLMNYFMSGTEDRPPLVKSQKEAYKLVQGLKTDPQKEILSIAKSLQAADTSYQKKPFSEYVKTAEQEVTALQQRLNNPNAQPSASTQTQSAPPEAVEYLRKNPHLAEQFKQKYGYLP